MAQEPSIINKEGDEQEWQPDQTISFSDQASEIPSVLPPATGSQPLKDNRDEGYLLSGKQIKILQSIAKKLTTLAADLNHLVQSLMASNTSEEVLAGQSGLTIEGYFNGEQMVASNGQVYEVPSNYASKSKLVEGDNLRLTIDSNGQFLYKQIGPVARRRLVATLQQGSDGNYYAVHGEQRWRLLKASVSYFRAEAGDRVTILIPKDKESQYAALENLVLE
ncbi:hypothetical protein KBI31_00135 [Patescibacteria group bacterium]|jgi:antitoxin component of MazEF toxin-antitoxin module|nr:hypothetical protein [Patescibacteria group bacterium]HPD07789.1 hypothetical protein [bacterium]HRT11115.1 hypothetical protein [Patescibacteria group bacterium]HRU89928.1 hypothetical protein [Patescibacteria group bacterium]